MRLSAVYTHIRLFNWINRSRCPGDQEGPEEEVNHSDIGWFSSACAGREEGWEGREGLGAHSTHAVCFHFTFAALRCRIRGDYHHDKITCTHGMAYGQNSFIRCGQWDLATSLRIRRYRLPPGLIRLHRRCHDDLLLLLYHSRCRAREMASESDWPRNFGRSSLS